ncbi:PiggyBac transposable element-derived protein, partial [Pseudoloma neurophilia]
EDHRDEKKAFITIGNRKNIEFSDPLTAFNYFFDDRVMNYCETRMNKKIYKENLEKQKNNKYTTEPEIYLFFGILLSLVSTRPRNFRDCWNKNKITYNNRIAKTLSRKRFCFLHYKFTLLSKKDMKNSLIAKKPKIIKYLLALFRTSFYPGEHMVIDETICAFKGRVLNRTYSPGKPDKFGIKTNSLCDLNPSFLLDLQIVVEQNNLNVMITEMMKFYEEKYHILHMDNFYSSVNLSKNLLRKKIIVMVL